MSAQIGFSFPVRSRPLPHTARKIEHRLCREKYVDAFWQPFESRVPQGCEQVVQDRLCCVEVLLRVCSAVSAISTLATSALTAENRGSLKTTMSLEADLQRTSPKRRDLTQMRIAGMSAIASAFGAVSGPDADIAKSTPGGRPKLPTHCGLHSGHDPTKSRNSR